MRKKHYIPSALAATVLASLALAGTALPASAATAGYVQTPKIESVKYDGSYYTPDDYDTVSIGDSKLPEINISTFYSTNGTVTVRDEDGSEICTAPILGTVTGVAVCKATAPLSAGHHVLTATTTNPGGTSEASHPLLVDAYADGDNGGGDNGGGDNGGGDNGGGDNGGGDNGGGDDGGGDDGAGTIAAPDVTLGDAVGSFQQLKLTPPDLGNSGSGTITVYDESGTKVIDRSYNLGGSEMSLYVDAPFGEKHTYQVEYTTPKGTSPRSSVTVDRTSGVVDAPTFAWSPDGYYKGQLVMHVKGVPGATVDVTNTAGGAAVSGTVDPAGNVQVLADVVPNALNEYSIVQTVNGTTSSALTHTLDKRSGDNGGGDNGGGDNGGGDNGGGDESDAPVAPRVLWGHLDSTKKEAVMTVIAGSTGHKTRVQFTTDDGKQHVVYVTRTIQEFRVKVQHLGAQDISVLTINDDDEKSDPTVFHLDAA